MSVRWMVNLLDGSSVGRSVIISPPPKKKQESYTPTAPIGELFQKGMDYLSVLDVCVELVRVLGPQDVLVGLVLRLVVAQVASVQLQRNIF